MLVGEIGPVTERLRVREIGDDEGWRLMRVMRPGSTLVVTGRRTQMVLQSAQGMDVPAVAKVTFTSQEAKPTGSSPHVHVLRDSIGG